MPCGVVVIVERASISFGFLELYGKMFLELGICAVQFFLGLHGMCYRYRPDVKFYPFTVHKTGWPN
jgi:hypothetical protein